MNSTKFLSIPLSIPLSICLSIHPYLRTSRPNDRAGDDTAGLAGDGMDIYNWVYRSGSGSSVRASRHNPSIHPSIHLYKPIYVWMGRSHNWVMGVKTRTEFGSIPQRKRNMSFVSPDQWSRWTGVGRGLGGAGGMYVRPALYGGETMTGKKYSGLAFFFLFWCPMVGPLASPSLLYVHA